LGGRVFLFMGSHHLEHLRAALRLTTIFYGFMCYPI
jgi:hypothetical protein